MLTMKRILFLLGFLLMLIPMANAQYSETFDTDDKGILGGPCTTNDPTTCALNDFSGVDWTITGDLSGMDATGPDDFRTSGGVMTSLNGDIDEEVCWVSPLLDISTAGAVSFTLDASISGHDGTDYLDVEYDIDGAGTWTQVANQAGGGTHTMDHPTDNNSNFSEIITVTGLTGNTLQIRVCVDFNSNTESFTIDNVSVPQNGVTVIIPCIDAAPPTITCPSAQTGVVDANCNFSIIDYTSLPTTTDDCGPVTVSQSPGVGEVINSVGATTVVLSATDDVGNTATCNLTVDVGDNIPPTTVCQNVTVEIGETVMANQVDNGSADNCDNSPGLSVSPTSFGCNEVGSQTLTLTVTDISGNTSTCIATATVQDNSAPSAVCTDFTVALIDATGNINDSDIDGGSSSLCNSVTLNASPSSFTCSELGPNTVTLNVTDSGNGNTSSCTAVIMVEDTTPPDAVCHDATITFNGEDSIALTVDQVWDNVASSDNCGNLSLVNFTPGMVTCEQVDTIVTISVTIQDDSGNMAQCTSNVTVDGMPCVVNDIEEQEFGATVSVYPNPSTGTIFIDIGEYFGEKAIIQVFNNLGKSILLQKIDAIQSISEPINLNSFQNGLYFIEIQIQNQPVITRKLILVK